MKQVAQTKEESMNFGYRKLFDSPIYAFLLTVFYILHGYWSNSDFVSVGTIWRMLFEYTTVLLILICGLFVLLKYWKVAASAAFYFFLANFYLTLLNDEARKFFGESWILNQSTWIVGVVVALTVYLIRLRRRPVVNLRNTRFLNLLFVFLILLEFAMYLGKPEAVNPIQPEVVANDKQGDSAGLARPDVYFILLDEYSGKRALKNFMNFDNSSFLTALRQRGFFVADSSLANYNSTLYSMASILNLNYLPDTRFDSTLTSDMGVAYRLIADAFLPKFLNSNGYDFYNNSWFHMKAGIRTPNPSYGPSERNFISGQTLLNRIRSNALKSIAVKLGWYGPFKSDLEENRDYNEAVKRNLLELAGKTSERHKFVYSHFSMPHYPFLYNKDGKPYSVDSLLLIEQGSRSHYVEYLQYCNEQVLGMIDQIVEKAGPKFQIFIVSDHGFRKIFGEHRASAAYDNIFCFYDSRVGEVPLFDQKVTNVNIFRSWVNRTFGASLDMLKDSTVRISF